MCHSALATFYLHVKDLLSNSLRVTSIDGDRLVKWNFFTFKEKVACPYFPFFLMNCQKVKSLAPTLLLYFILSRYFVNIIRITKAKKAP